MLAKIKQVEKEISSNRNEVIDGLVRLSVTDLLFFWGSEREVIERQEKLWLPVIKWLEDGLNARLKYTQSLSVPEQDSTIEEKLRKFIDKFSDKELTAFYIATLTLRSTLLATAFVRKKITVEEAFDAAFLEEKIQSEKWGATEEMEKRQESIKKELFELDKFLNGK